MGLFGKIRENLQKNRGTLAQKLMGGMGIMNKMPVGMRPRRGEGIVQGMFPRLDKTRMRRMPEPNMRVMPMMPPEPIRPLPPSKGMPIDPGRMPRFKGGGSADKQYPNKGLAALAEVAPEVVKRMGYEGGGAVVNGDAVVNYRRRSAQMMIDELMGAIQNGSPEEMANKSFLLERLQDADLSPEQENMVFAISRMLKERNIPVGGMKVTETSVEMMPGEMGRDISDRDKDNISEMLANMS